MDATLNKDILAGRWEQVKSKIKQRWGRLSDEQLDQIHGYHDELTRLVRERYGYTKEKACQEVDELIEKLELLEQQP